MKEKSAYETEKIRWGALQEIKIVDVKIPFMSIAWLMFKMLIISIPISILVFLLYVMGITFLSAIMLK